MAGTVIAVLTAQRLNSRILVTGQDAIVSGIQHILLGNQAMTVYTSLVKKAEATARLATAISMSQSTSTITNATTAVNTAQIPSVLLGGIAVDINNVHAAVIADGYVTRVAVCSGISAGTHGDVICP